MDEATAQRLQRTLDEINGKLNEVLEFRDQVFQFAAGKFGLKLLARRGRK